MNASIHARRSIALAALALTAACGDAAPPGPEPTAATSQAVAALTPITGFGANPGNLLMYAYVPKSAPANAPLVLALHGCTEGATDYEDAGWDALADTYGFYVVYPQQQSSNNIEECFNWFGNTSGSTADITRGQGEAASIAQMVDAMKAKYSIDAKRVYATGFSAGAAYAVALLAMYPDVFAAGASFSGVPFGCATSLTTAYTCMGSAVSKTPSAWATLAKAGYPGYAGPYPRLSVWQGSSDTTVNTANLSEIVQQWTALTGVSQTPTATDTVAGFPHASYANASGAVQVESYSITGMSHAVSIDTGTGCGTAGTYFVNESLCAASAAAQFFGIVPGGQGGSSGSSGGGSSGVATSSGGGGSGAGGSGSGSSGSGVASSSGTTPTGSGGGAVTASSSGSAGTAADAPDAGAAAVANMPGCSVGRGATGSGAGAGASAFLVVAFLAGAALARRSRRARRLLAGLTAGTALFAATPAHADDGAAGDHPGDDVAPVPAPDEKPTPKHAYLGPRGTFFTGASVSALPAVLFGYFPVDHLATTIGLGLTYDANGSPTSPLTGIKGAPNNRVGSDAFLDVIYFVHDAAPFAMGPELNFIGSLSPNYPMTAVVVTPMWALRYAPWKAPVAIGTGLGVGFTFERGMKPMASLATQGLDIVYAF